MFKSSFQIARVFGIPIRLDLSLLLLMGWIWLNTLRTGMGPLPAFLLGGAYALLLLLSIVLHELGHSLVARRFGCRVREITLMLLGGRAMLSNLPTRPIQEFAVAVAGPAVSLALWLGGRFGGAFLSRLNGSGTALAAGLLLMLGMMNYYLFWFNLVPAFPMDGGRVLRAVLAHRLGRLRATYIAATLGRALAVAGIAWALGDYFGFWTGPFSSMMLALIALFIFQAAGQEYRLVQLEAMYASSGQRPPWMPPPPPDRVVVGPAPYDREPPARP